MFSFVYKLFNSKNEIVKNFINTSSFIMNNHAEPQPQNKKEAKNGEKIVNKKYDICNFCGDAFICN